MNAKTERDYEDPAVTQLAVFLQNRVGALRDVLKCLDQAGVTVHALSVIDGADFAVVRLVVDETRTARSALQVAKFAVTESEVLAAELPDERSNLFTLCQALIRGEVNIHYAYPMITRPNGRAVAVLHVDSRSEATEMLRRAGFLLIDEHDLLPKA